MATNKDPVRGKEGGHADGRSVAAGTAPRARDPGGRAMPGKVPRGSRHRDDTEVFTAAGRALVEHLGQGVLLLDADGLLLDSNALAQRLLGRSSGIALRGGRLAFAEAALDERFVRWLQQVQQGGTRSIVLTVRRSARPSYRVHAMPCLPDPRDVACLVLIYAPEEQRQITAEVLAEVYGLTGAQAQVARKLYAGCSVEETAVSLGLSLNTVRSHLKQIFSKCEVQSQAELLRTLALGPKSL
jgi:DNA-binding CsgD family transcriptional regulator